MSLLFAGHKGFLGRELIPYLRELDDVVVFEGDLRDYEALRVFSKTNSVTKIFHAAARGGRRNKLDTPETLHNNVNVTSNLLRLELPTILFCSGAVYDRRQSINEAKEQDSLNSFPEDFYGQSKYIAVAIGRSRGSCNILRFFNVFGATEGIDRFITYNIMQYINRQPMLIYSDFRMDFFYVLDTLPILRTWVKGGEIPMEVNMVYKTKFFLSDICNFINSLSDYIVPIIKEIEGVGKNYTGDGSRLDSMGLPLVGLEQGIIEMYRRMLSSAETGFPTNL